MNGITSGKGKSIILGILIGSMFGIGTYTFIYARGYAYLTNNPASCANCHVMNEQYDGWLKSSHRAVATCNDCHTPPGLISKYAVKASNGFWHSFAFTTGWFHEPIQIGLRNRNVTEESCLKCHAGFTESIRGPHSKMEGEAASCVRCHRSVGHMH
ncbi:MAG: cytochrome c nitrite reductase small subunit [Acidobacteria bacterium]|nr:cytochrome c nitrite reductase small subunit [Acidobacteriota bacterium]MBK9709573.1 cytochrome c nitrite reductase small subunit [Acidobacteriota bacterium]